MNHQIYQITDQNFSTTIANDSKPVLVDFWAAWCQPCRAMDPVVKNIAETYAERMVVGQINVDDNPQTPAQFGIRGIPTLILFKDGKEIARQIGSTNRDTLVKFIENHLAVAKN